MGPFENGNRREQNGSRIDAQIKGPIGAKKGERKRERNVAEREGMGGIWDMTERIASEWPFLRGRKEDHIENLLCLCVCVPFLSSVRTRNPLHMHYMVTMW